MTEYGKIRKQIIQTLCEEAHGFEKLCDCAPTREEGIEACERNYPHAETLAWARGALEALNSTEHCGIQDEEIEWSKERYRKKVGR